MPAKHSKTPDDRNDRNSAIRRERSRILSSKAFRQVERLQLFLTYIVDETLAGRSERLKEFSIGVDVFAKTSKFDPRMDPIVRVQARRLRMRLATYYETEGKTDDVVIELPKGGYTPTFRHRQTMQSNSATATALVSRNSVAVVLFSDDTEAGDELSFCKGLFHEIIRALGAVDALLVVADISVGGRKDHPPAALSITGSVQKSQGVMRITTHVTDSLRGCYVWTGFVEGSTDNRFKIQEQVAQSVVQALQDSILDTDHASGSKHARPENFAAQNLYLQGRHHLNQRTERGLRKAIGYFSEAIKEDPKLADAYAGLADAHNLSAHYGMCAPAEVWTKAASNASHAILLDNESSAGHASLAHILATQDWDWPGAEAEFRRAISLDQRNATAHHWYAVACLAPLGRFVEAMEEIKLARALDPLSSIIVRDIALLYYYYQRNYDLALEQCDQVIEQNPHFSAAYWTLGLVQEQRGEMDEAIAAFQRAIELSPPSPRILGALGGALARDGNTEEACRILGELGDLSKNRYISPFELALIHFNLGRKDEGFELLTKAFDDRCVEVYNLSLDPRFESVRPDPRFKALFRRLKLP